jgi:hypothetical protein
MTAFNVVKFRVLEGREEEFLDAHRALTAKWPGLIRATMIKTGERSFCVIGEWAAMDDLAAARPAMLQTLDTFRATLEDLGEGRGPTDAASGPVVLELN